MVIYRFKTKFWEIWVKSSGPLLKNQKETPLESWRTIQDTFSGSLGKTSTSLIGRLMSSKMPGGFSITNAKKILGIQIRIGSRKTRFSFINRDCVMNQPVDWVLKVMPSHFLDTMAQKYASHAGISLSSPSAGGAVYQLPSSF